MINCILLEDTKREWDSFKLKLETDFATSIYLMNQQFLATFEEMQAFVQENILDTHLIIADVALDEDHHNDETRWSPQLITNVLNDEDISRVIERKGIAIIFMTAFTKEEYATIMRNRFPNLFNSDFIYQTSIRKGKFSDDIRDVINQQFRQEFTPTTDNNWIRIRLIQTYLEAFGERSLTFKIYNSDNNINIKFKDVIAFEYRFKNVWRMRYKSKRGVIKTSIEANTKELFNALNLFEVKDGRDVNRTRETFHRIASTVYFLHIARRSHRIINTQAGVWLYCGTDNGNGKDLTLQGTKFTTRCTFNTYNYWFKSEHNQRFRRP